MSLRIQFNLLLLLAFLIGFALQAYLADRTLKANAREEVIQSSRIMMESALGARAYTSEHVRPLLSLQMKRKFLPEAVSAYAAAQSFKALQTKFPDYSYKEAALNPTNPQDLASDWEAVIIGDFVKNPELKELAVERDTPSGRVLNLARPLGLHDEACLSCHGQAEAAPKTMTDIYGVNNGFGWKMGDIIGAQVVTVPMSVPLARAKNTLTDLLIQMSGVFLWLLLLLNLLLHFAVIRPVARIVDMANDVSLGKPNVPEYTKSGTGEISSLSQSFNRMRHSLEQAMKLLDA